MRNRNSIHAGRGRSISSVRGPCLALRSQEEFGEGVFVCLFVCFLLLVFFFSDLSGGLIIRTARVLAMHDAYITIEIFCGRRRQTITLRIIIIFFNTNCACARGNNRISKTIITKNIFI